MKEKINILFFPKKTGSWHVNSLDGFRGNAILILLLTHSSNWGMLFSKNLNFQLAGRSGACLFFVLSSYLLSRQMIHILTGKKPLIPNFKKFYIRRFLRIYPLYAIGLLILGVLTYYFGNIGMYNYPLKNAALHLLLLRGAGIFWTLAVELKYYLALPFFMLICYKLTQFKFIKAIVFLFVFYAFAFCIWALTHFRPFPFMESIPAFLMGTFIAVFEFNHKEKTLKKSKRIALDYAGVLCIAVMLLHIPYYHDLIFGGKMNIKQALYYPFFGFLWAFVMLSARLGDGLIKRIFEIKPLVFLGTIAYSIYIFHLPVLFFIHSNWLHLAEGLKIYAFILTTLVLATISYLVIERPLTLLKIKFE